MRALRISLTIIGISQLVLGALYLFAPRFFISLQGLAEVPADTAYPLAMLAARFLVYGVGMFVIARNPAKNMFWLNGMIAIQVIDLGAGLFYTFTGIVPLAVSGMAMLNATVFTGLMLAFRGQAEQKPAQNLSQNPA